MACDVNVYKGRELLLAIRNDADTEWNILGGISTANVDFANNTVDITSQTTTGDYSEKQFDGFSDLTIAGDYFADSREGGTEPNTGYTVVSAKRLLEIQANPERCGLFQVIDPEFIIEGELTLSAFNRSAEIKGVISGSITLESRNAVTIQVL